MTLLFDETKTLEKAVGEEATRAILTIVEASKNEAATKADLEIGLKALEVRLVESMAAFKSETIKWVAGLLVAQSAIIVALVKLLVK